MSVRACVRACARAFSHTHAHYKHPLCEEKKNLKKTPKKHCHGSSRDGRQHATVACCYELHSIIDSAEQCDNGGHRRVLACVHSCVYV